MYSQSHLKPEHEWLGSPYALRLAFILALTHDLQNRISQNRLYETDALLARCGSPEVWDWFEQKLSESVPKPEAVPGYSRKKLLRRLFQILEKMEVLRPEWKQYRTQAEKTLMEAAPFSPEQEAAFQTLFTDIAAEQLMVYFLFTYFAGAVYDGDAWGKMKFSFAAMVAAHETLFEKCAGRG